MTLSEQIAEILLSEGAAADAATLARVQFHIADSVGIALAARARNDMAAGVIRSIGGNVDEPDLGYTILGGGSAPTAEGAAFANGALVHLLDFDDIHDEARLHPTCITLPAALAALQSPLCQRPDELTRAVLVGNEIMCRLGLAISPTGSGGASNWFLTQALGYLGATATAGYLLGFDSARLASAFGLAYMQIAGGKEVAFGTGSNARGIYPAFAAAGGVRAAWLAANGLTGTLTAFDGAAGLFDIYFGSGLTRDQIELVTRRGQWESLKTDVKLWPCCRLSHPYVQECMEIRGSVEPGAVTEIRISVNESAGKLCRPLAARIRPDTLADAKYSIPFMVAFTMMRGAPTLETLNEAALKDAGVLALCDKIVVVEDLADRPGHPPAKISLTQGGQEINSSQRALGRADPEQLRAKFDTCLSFAGHDALYAEEVWAACVSGTAGPPSNFSNLLGSPRCQHSSQPARSGE